VDAGRPSAPEAQIKESRALLAAGDATAAVACLRSTISTSGGNAQLWHLLALALHQDGSKVQAMEAIQKSLQLDGSQFGAWLLLCEWAFAAGNLEALRHAAEKAHGLVPGDLRVAAIERVLAEPAVLGEGSAAEASEVAEAAVWFRLSNYPAALKSAREVLETNPRSATAIVLVGRIALKCSNQAKMAAELFARALELRPGEIEIDVLLADALRLQGRPREAGERLANALRAHPHNLSALLSLASVHRLLQESAKSEALLREAVEHHPQSPEAARGLGDSLKRRGELKEAMAWHWRSVGASVPKPASGRKRVLFLAQQGPLWLNVASVYEAFAADPAWEVVVVAMPYLHPYCVTEADRNGIFPFLEQARVPYVRWDQFTLAPACADVVFVPTPWDDVRAPGWRTMELLRHGLRLAYIPYCFETADDESDQFQQPLHELAWAVFARSEGHKALFARHCSVGSAHVTVAGHPKMDALRRLDSVRDPELEAFVAGRKAVCWNPHFSVIPGGSEFGTGYSTFLRWQRFLPEEFARRPDMALLIRPHPLFFGSLLKLRVWTQTEIDAFLARCAEAGNILIDRRPTYLPVFAASDAMMSDIGTFVLEYPMTGKPLLYLRNPFGAGAGEGTLIGGFCEVAETEAEIVRFLDAVAKGFDPRANERRIAYGNVIYQPPRGAGDAVKRAIDSRLAAEAKA
jgi:tetratricopeptide (TPR) repeat protein